MTTHIRGRSGIVLAAGLLACIACSSSKTADDGTAAPGASTSATDPLAFHFSTGPFTVKPGDNFECFYTDTITDRVLNVQSARGKQGPGGHHLIVYYTDQKVPVGHHPCQDVEMLGLHQIAADAGNNEGIVALPDGYATKVPAGKQLVIQAHYIRTEDGPLTVEDEIDLKTVDDKDVKAFANSFVMVDGTFKIPPRAAMTSTTKCSVPKDLDLLIMTGHMHEWGSHYKLERIDEKGNSLETLYDAEWETLFVAHPPIKTYDPKTPLHFAKGTLLRQTCSWKNTDDQEKAFPREMCVMFSYYVPDDGFIECDTQEVKP